LYRESIIFRAAVFVTDGVYSKIRSKSTHTGRLFPEDTEAVSVASHLQMPGGHSCAKPEVVIAALNKQTAGPVPHYYGNHAPNRFFFEDATVSALDKPPALC
jgi:hypothetical protein